MNNEAKDNFLLKRANLIEKFEHNKYNLHTLMLEYECSFKLFKNKHYKEISDKKLNLLPRISHISSDIEDLLYCLKNALLAPSYHYNNYIEALVSELSISKESSTVDNEELIFCIYQIEVDSILLSLKTGLDRMVAIFSYYYKGVSPEGSTFGHFNSKTNKFEGFMSVVNQHKEKDELSKYIYDQYFFWIKKVVDPRDTIIHYNSLGIYKEYDHEYQAPIPIHFNERLFKIIEFDESSEHRFNYESLKQYIDKWIDFTQTVFTFLLNKNIKENPQRIKYPNADLGFSF